jgi:transcriptional regulator with XRE-family HTH domain
MPRYKGKLEESVELSIFQIRLANALKEMRKRDRFNLKDLAAGVGISNTYMTKIMRAQANISISLLFSFCKALDVSVTDLIGLRADDSTDVTLAADTNFGNKPRKTNDAASTR